MVNFGRPKCIQRTLPRPLAVRTYLRDPADRAESIIVLDSKSRAACAAGEGGAFSFYGILEEQNQAEVMPFTMFINAQSARAHRPAQATARACASFQPSRRAQSDHNAGPDLRSWFAAFRRDHLKRREPLRVTKRSRDRSSRNRRRDKQRTLVLLGGLIGEAFAEINPAGCTPFPDFS